MRLILLILLTVLTSCISPFDKGSVDVKIKSLVSKKAKPEISNVTLNNDQLTITGANFKNLKSVRLNSQNLSVISNSNSSLILSASSSVLLALNTVLNLVVETASGAASVAVTFNLVDGSVTASKIGDGEIGANHLSSMGATSGQVMQWNGTTWVPTDLSGLVYLGDWDATTAAPAASIAGEYYIISNAGTTDLSGNNSWAQGDWAIFDGVNWAKIDNSTGVKSFNGRSGVVTPQNNDYTWNQIDKTISSINDIADVDTSGVTTNDVLKWDGAKWIVAPDETVSAGSVTTSAIADGTIQAADLDAGLNTALSQVTTNTSDISDNASDIATNASAIATNAGNISANATSIAGHTTSISNLASTKADKTITVNGQALNANVVLDSDDVNEGIINLYYSNSRAKAAAVVNSTAGSEADQAASVSAMKSYVLAQVGGVDETQWITDTSDIYYSAGKVSIGSSTIGEQLLLTSSSDDVLGIHRTNNVLNNANKIHFYHNDSTSAKVETVEISSILSDPTSGSVDGDFAISTVANGSKTEKFRITSSGQVGIGVVAPTEKLEVSGNVKATAFYGDGSNLTGINASSSSNTGDVTIAADSDTNTSGAINFNTAGTTKMSLTNSGNLGIGNSSPTNSFTIGSNLGSGYAISANSQTAYGQTLQTSEAVPTSNAALWVRTTADGGSTANTLFRVQNNGNVGIGNAAPVTTLDVSGTLKLSTLSQACTSTLEGTLEYISSSMSYRYCDGTEWVQLKNQSVIPASARFVMKTCPGGWTDIGTTGAGSGSVILDGVEGRVCEAPASETLLPASSILALESCPNEWTSLGASSGQGTAGCADRLACNICQSPNKSVGLPTGVRFLMSTCPTDWTDVGVPGGGQAAATCAGSSCRVCRSPGVGATNSRSIIGDAGGANTSGVSIVVMGGKGGSTSGQSGGILLSSGTPIDGNSGLVQIQTQSAASTTGTARSSGNLSLSTGFGVNGGSAGYISLQAGGDGASAFSPIIMQDSGGNVGIGTSVPDRKLQVSRGGVNSSIRLDGFVAGGSFSTLMTGSDFGSLIEGGDNGQVVLALKDNDNNDGFRIISGGGDFMADSIYDTNVFTAQSNGNVGIGTSAPTQALHVKSTSGVMVLQDSNSLESDVAFTSWISGQDSTGLESWWIGEGSATAKLVGLSAGRPGYEISISNDSGSIRLADDGNVGIGTATPGGKLHIQDQTSGANPSLYVYRNVFTTGTDALISASAWDGGTSSVKEQFRVQANGFVGIGTSSPSHNLHVIGTAGLSTGTAWTNTSDRRLKDIRGDYGFGLKEILKLNTVRFNYKKDNELNLPSDKEIIGFIAQEVKDVIPEAVVEREDGYLELNVDPIHWATVNAVQDLYNLIQENKAKFELMQNGINEKQNRQIASLKEENEILKSKIDDLEERIQRLEKILSQ